MLIKGFTTGATLQLWKLHSVSTFGPGAQLGRASEILHEVARWKVPAAARSVHDAAAVVATAVLGGSGFQRPNDGFYERHALKTHNLTVLVTIAVQRESVHVQHVAK